MRRTPLRLVVLVAAALPAAVAGAQTETNQIMGRLGHFVGTELTIEGTFKGGKNGWILVTKVNGRDLPTPVTVSTVYIPGVSRIPTNTICRFKGAEITYVIKPVVNPQTGEEMQQAASGRHLDFKVTEVIVPEGVKVREEEGADKAPKAAR